MKDNFERGFLNPNVHLRAAACRYKILVVYVGFCGGAFTIAAPVFITETSDVNIRGALGSGFDMMITVGILYM